VIDVSTGSFPVPRLYAYQRFADARYYDVYGVGADGRKERRTMCGRNCRIRWPAGAGTGLGREPAVTPDAEGATRRYGCVRPVTS